MSQSLAVALPASTALRESMRVAVYGTAREAEAVWAELEAVAPASCYQTRGWLRSWIDTIGAAQDAQPMLIAAFDECDRPVLLLPLCVVRSRGLNVARFMGGKDANFNMALVRPGTAFAASGISALLAAARDKARRKPDLYILSNQPPVWEGVANPMCLLPHQPSPSFGYKTALEPDAEGLLRAKLSKDGAKKLNRKERRLADLGAVRYYEAAGVGETRAVIDAFLAQKTARLATMGVTGLFDGPDALEFLLRCAQPAAPGAKPAMQWFALAAGGRIVATYAGGVHRGRFHGMVSSFDLDPAIAAASPGELLLRWLVAECCRRGLATFDLGVGEAGYKNGWCDVAEPLCDSFVSVSLKGRAGVRLAALRAALKRAVKQTPWAWALARKIRSWR